MITEDQQSTLDCISAALKSALQGYVGEFNTDATLLRLKHHLASLARGADAEPSQEQFNAWFDIVTDPEDRNKLNINVNMRRLLTEPYPYWVANVLWTSNPHYETFAGFCLALDNFIGKVKTNG